MARRIAVVTIVTVVGVTTIGCGFASPALAFASSASAAGRTSSAAHAWLGGRGHHLHRGSHGEVDVNVCTSSIGAGVARCDARVRADLFGKTVRPEARGAPAAPSDLASDASVGNNGAYDPAYLRSAYNAPAAGGVGQTVAIVDAFDAPNVESDLAFYRSFFGLPACTTANGCFSKIDQDGGTGYPAAHPGWAQEITLDVQMVSAICPSCHILLAEANDASLENLGIAVNRAVALGANVVSNSYGAEEFAGEELFNAPYYDHPGVAIVASSGDSGYGVSYPASSPTVVAVGGTTLLQAADTGVRDATETVWSGAGSGCSASEPKPAWQTDTSCSNRAVADVAAVADPTTGVWVYNRDDGGWEIFGGTSVAAPIVGAFYALADNGPSNAQVGSYPYAHSSALNDVVSGSNGSCGGTYLCTGGPQYDGPTGLGSPNTAAAFSADGVAPPAPTPPPLPPPAVADFSITASTSGASMNPGSTAKRTVRLTPRNGFTGTVSLSASVSPGAGLTKRVSQRSIALGATPVSATVTLGARIGGTYTVTVTASHGPVVHKKSLTVFVNDFSMRVSPKTMTVARGKKARYTVTLKPTGTFKGVVKLSTAGLGEHDNVAYAHNPVPASGPQTITVSTSTLDVPGMITLRFTGVSGVLKHSVVVVLMIQ